MKIETQKRIDRYLGIAICAFLSVIHQLRVKRPVPEPRRVLVILLSEMGSLVLAHPMFEAIKRKYPGASIHVLLFAKNAEVLELLEVTPKENILTLDDATLSRFARDSLRALRSMRRIGIDTVIDCELFARVSSIFSYLSGARLRVGFSPYEQEGLYRGSFINRPVAYNPYQHLSRQFLTLVEAMDSSASPTAKRLVGGDPIDAPQVRFADDELARLKQRLLADFPQLGDKTLVLIYPSGGVLPIRAWPVEHYCRLTQSLLADGYAVAIVGLAADKPVAARVQDHCQSDDCVDLTGYTKSVRELLALFHHAALLITNDGGPGQFAALTPMPSIILFGPETPVLYGSNTRNAHFFYLSFSCSPCLTAYNHRSSPCDGDNQCLKQIAPGEVYAKACEILGTTARD